MNLFSKRLRLTTDRAGAESFPAEFVPNYYRSKYADLKDLSDEQAAEHYRLFGKSEGRIASPAGTREGFIALVPRNAQLLEIGPAHKPVFTGSSVRYFDVQDAAGLRDRATTHNEDPSRTPAKIDFVSPTGDLSIVEGVLDAVFSSHAIEHQPDLVQHLIDIERLLKPGGAYFVICPDKRYCFDRHIPESTIGDVIEAHLLKRRVHRLADVIDQYVLSCHNEPSRHWKGDSPAEPLDLSLTKLALERCRTANGGYIDVHAWRMSSSAFKRALEVIHEIGLSPLAPIRVYETPYGSNEFFFILARD